MSFSRGIDVTGGKGVDGSDRMSALFWVGMGIAICIESIRLGPGQLSSPGPGLIPLGCGLFLGFFGTVVFIRTFKMSSKESEGFRKQKPQWRKLTLTLASLVSYAFLLDFLGFKLVTLFWMVFICRLGKMGWRASVLISVITMFSSYILFGYYLGIRFPRGILGF